MTDMKAKLWTVLVVCGGLSIFFLFVNVPGCSGIFIIPALLSAAILMLMAAVKSSKNQRYREHAIARANALPEPGIEPEMETPGNSIIELPITRYQ